MTCFPYMTGKTKDSLLPDLDQDLLGFSCISNKNRCVIPEPIRYPGPLAPLFAC